MLVSLFRNVAGFGVILCPSILCLSILCLSILCLSSSVAAMSVLPGCASQRAQEAFEPRRGAYFADKVVVKKGQRRLYLMRDGEPFRTYRISLGANPLGHKERQGDSRTPEGRYVIDWRNPKSNFYKALHISYPNLHDRARAQRNGWDPGGAIMIHGEPRATRFAHLRDVVRYEDWTEGCIAVSNLAVDEIWRYVTDGTPIEIQP
jgi:murein L,D-transpeptidase YafK